ncbi:MAG: hypothetical protein F6K35_38135 [Okeania sp. SIO2H7]|nr:hypothetical protein [Okeania sp. SIO2H7]
MTMYVIKLAVEEKVSEVAGEEAGVVAKHATGIASMCLGNLDGIHNAADFISHSGDVDNS